MCSLSSLGSVSNDRGQLVSHFSARDAPVQETAPQDQLSFFRDAYTDHLSAHFRSGSRSERPDKWHRLSQLPDSGAGSNELNAQFLYLGGQWPEPQPTVLQELPSFRPSPYTTVGYHGWRGAGGDGKRTVRLGSHPDCRLHHGTRSVDHTAFRANSSAQLFPLCLHGSNCRHGY